MIITEEHIQNNKPFWVTSSYVDAHTYFVFRQDKTEYKVVIRNNMMMPTKNMKPLEAQYFRDNILEKGEIIKN